MTGLYLHIPFCASRCIYCDFYTTTQTSLRTRYVEALCREMQLVAQPELLPLSTIYLGGGTPSQLSHEQLLHIFSQIEQVFEPCSSTQEITLEANPDDVHKGMLRGLPINRVSMGAQSFGAERLKLIKRRHTPEQVDEAVRTLRQEGIKNISVDLIYGFPDETLEEWDEDITHLLRLNVEHISAYSLMYEEGTPLYKMLQQGKVKEIDDNLSNEMFLRLVERLTSEGYEHYEISNFARHGFRARHNAAYWHGIPYLGIGAAAHSYNGQRREWNVASLHKYIAAIEEGRLPREGEEIDDITRYNDLIVTALRTREGIDLSQLSATDRTFLLQCATPHIKAGRLLLDSQRIHLSYQGILLSNTVMSDLMRVED